VSIEACAQMVEQGDPDRFLSAMTGTPHQRALLFPLYAFNLEIARAPFASREPMVARMRLQFWADTLEEIAAGKVAHDHQVAGPLAGVIHQARLAGEPFQRMIDARIGDVEGAARQTADQLFGYCTEVSGNLMVLAGAALGADKDQRPGLYALGSAAGVANWLLALPRLESAGRGFIAPTPQVIGDLASRARKAQNTAIKSKSLKTKTLYPALRAAWRCGPVLRAAQKTPQKALTGGLETSEFSRRATLLLRSAAGRW